MAKRKNRTAISKNRNKAMLRQKRRKKAKSREVGRQDRGLGLSPMIVDRPAITDVEAPEGFRAVGMAQGMSEYAKPLMELAEKSALEDLNAVLQVGMATWNYTLSEEGEGNRERNKITREIQRLFRLGPQEATDLFEKMIERKHYLFPEDIQPTNPMMMYIRKEISYIINAFNYEALQISANIVPPGDEDRKLVRAINKLDKYIEEEADYSDYESHYFSTRDQCVERFEKWLIQKGLDERSQDFSSCLDPYLDFVYAYMHDEIVILKNISSFYIEEFFADYLLRKVMAEPCEYVEWPPSLKLFYSFLGEMGYLDNPIIFIDIFTVIEPEFVKNLRHRYA